MPEPTPHNATPEAVPDELVLMGKITGIAAAGGIFGTLVLWLAEPTRIQSGTAEIVGVLLTAATGVVALLAPWERLSRRWVMAPVVSGAALTALACWNTGGTGSLFALFYLYVACMAAYFASRTQTLIACGAVAVCAGLPVFYDHGASLTDRIFEWVLISSLTTALALILQRQREGVRRSAEHAHALALQDPLTGVANRRGFEQRAAAELARARRHRLVFTLLYVDLDGFKRINDVAGHAAGDELLRRVALAIGVAVRGEDFVARHGGDEFAILLPSTDSDEARRVAARVIAAVERTAADDPRLGGLSASVGGASYPADGDSVATLIEQADGELLRVKAERSFDRERASREYSIPEVALEGAADPFAALDAVPSPRTPWAKWDLRAASLLAVCLAALALAGWFLLPLAAGREPGRVGMSVVGALAVAVAAFAAGRRARGRERSGWWLVSAGAMVGYIPLSGGLAGILVAAGLLLVGLLPAGRDRRPVLDSLEIFCILCAFAFAFLVDPLVEDPSLSMQEAARGFGATLTATLAVTCALLLALRVPVRRRPDLWLAVTGFALAGVGAIPFALDRSGAEIPMSGWHVVFPLAAALVVAGATLRARNPDWVLPTGDDGPGLGGAPGTVLILGLLISLVATHGAVPATLVVLFLPIVLIRYARARVYERDNARLAEAARQGERAVAAQYRASLLALGTALEARDGYTGSHGEETVALVCRVAERLGLSEAAIAEAEATALLHDIGKIGMPDEILRKPGKLDEHEWAIVREHPLIGERILRQVPGLDNVAKAVRHEHERWDGKGYPDGLRGEAIPLASRITLVCDAYHAMTSDRPYRAAMTHEEAAEELRRCAGIQFDPAVVTAMLATLAEQRPVTRPPRRSPAARRAVRAAG